MKRMDLFCASPASTAICSSMDRHSMVRHSTTRPPPNNHHGSHPHHHLHDRRRSRSSRSSAPPSPHIPCSSKLPINPKPYYYRQTSHKVFSSSSSVKESDIMRRKSSADMADKLTRSPPPTYGDSSRFLLSDTPFFNFLSDDSDHVSSSSLVPYTQPQPIRTPARTRQIVTVSSSNDSPALKSSTSSRSHDQVVVLRVSLHCKGCEGKVRKHISRMEGVTSFSIDFEMKKVTITGDVTPLDVLASVSKVKNAQFWPSPSPRLRHLHHHHDSNNDLVTTS